MTSLQKCVYKELKREYSDKEDNKGVRYVMSNDVIQSHYRMLESDDEDFVDVVGIMTSQIVKVEDGYKSEDSVLCVGDSLVELSQVNSSRIGDDERKDNKKNDRKKNKAAKGSSG